jgi:phage/plasmid-associated DNA primase
MGEYTPQFTTFILCNDLPKIDKIDGGVERRLKVINFPVKFVDSPSKSNERKINRNLKGDITQDFINEMCLLMLETAYKHIKEDIIIPSSVKKQIDAYVNDNNPVKSFLDDVTVKADTPKDRIDMKTLYDMFKFSEYKDPNITKSVFKNQVIMNKIDIIESKRTFYATYLKFRPVETVEEEDVPNELDV